ncbi:UvrD-helicase domain-containing protein [Candidatus Gracilibacteria bacterium]|nr:UvrD-helicase domain-containing protein [Candidatus Gracilibacteria bacterium]NUJ99202.1 UvrD-helicase domain-containing protein [Candidatus Gracilibacteria bacterium]
MNLNERQQEAVKCIEGPLLIIAGAGSGKTATLTARVENMIKNHGISPQNILCVTFTNKAAREMKERIAKNLGIDSTQIRSFKDYRLPFMGTFHSFGVSVLKEYIEILDYKKDFIIYDTADSVSLIKQILREMKFEEKEFPPRKIQTYISTAKNSLLTPSQYEQYVDSSFKEVVRDVYHKYQKKLQENNALDFDDILIKTHNILQKPEILATYQERYTYIMVDEYQDTNITQYEIIKMLASKYRNLAVVGDDWQSIYSWRGADMRNILNFKKDYPEALVIKLEQNYRSTKHIINAANEVIKNNKNALSKTLWTENCEGECITLIEAPDDRNEAKKIAEIIVEQGRPYSKNLVLYRTNGQSRQIEEYLIGAGIPYKVVGGLKFYDRMEIKDLLAYLKILYNSQDSISMKRIINVPVRKIGARSLEVLDEYKNNYDLSYLQILENIEDVEDLKGAAKISLANFYTLYRELRKKLNSLPSLREFAEYMIQKIGYKDYLKGEYSEAEYDAKIENIDELINVLSAYEGIETIPALGQFIDEVSLLTDMDQLSEENDFVTLMTIHTSKGLERENVFIAGVEDGILPHIRTIGNQEELEEERRLMYVAMTRAKEKLYISRAKERFQFGEYMRNPKSRFIDEIPLVHTQEIGFTSEVSFFGDLNFGGNLSSSPSSETFQKVIKTPKIDNDIASFSIGDRLSHPKFGIGIITDLNGELAEIAFNNGGLKKMNIRIAPVKKV